MLSSTDDERRAVIDYVEAQGPRSRVESAQRLYSERLSASTHDIWDVHTRRGRWWVVTNPTNLYSQKQFPNMDLALTFHIGSCVRMPRTERTEVANRPVEPLLACWRAFDQIAPVLITAQEAEDYHAIGVRCRECLLSLVHSIQDATDLPVQT